MGKDKVLNPPEGFWGKQKEIYKRYETQYKTGIPESENQKYGSQVTAEPGKKNGKE
jgi:hypothetical protein